MGLRGLFDKRRKVEEQCVYEEDERLSICSLRYALWRADSRLSFLHYGQKQGMESVRMVVHGHIWLRHPWRSDRTCAIRVFLKEAQITKDQRRGPQRRAQRRRVTAALVRKKL